MGLPYPKQLLPFGKSSMLEHVIALFSGFPITVAFPGEHRAAFEALLATKVQLVEGGATRFQSVRNAINAISNLHDEDLILIHDAARPFFNPATLQESIPLASEQGALIYAQPATDTIKRISGGNLVVRETIPRETIFMAQTPQIFRADVLRKAYAAFDRSESQLLLTDEAGLVEMAGIPVHLFPSQADNRKITLGEDLKLLTSNYPRTGHGYDVHRFTTSRPLFLCGVEIPGGPGLAGHSDADVALHALIDALLGAVAKGDIGSWFPDNDPQYAGIRSTELLKKVWVDLQAEGWALINADITIQAQVPKLAPYRVAMCETIAKIMAVEVNQINVKATTTEGLGFVGKREGMAAQAVVSVIKEGTP
jgi:2-C-methyl-D-erythritol 4-phosphate cytidylyltransferase/2-C-methyl-D-erythritol 2,4-cyclodiphosphate synthase